MDPMDFEQLVDYKMRLLKINSLEELVARARTAGHKLSASTVSHLRAGKISLTDATLAAVAAAIDEHPYVIWVAYAVTKGFGPPGAAEFAALAVATVSAQEVDRPRVYSTGPRTTEQVKSLLAQAHDLVARQQARAAGKVGDEPAPNRGGKPRRPTAQQSSLPEPRGKAAPTTVFQAAGDCLAAEA